MAEPLVIFFLTLHDAGIFYRLGIIILTDSNAFIAQLAIQALGRRIGLADFQEHTRTAVLEQGFHSRAQEGLAITVAPGGRVDGDVGQLAFIGDEPDVSVPEDLTCFPFQDVATGLSSSAARD